MLCENTSYELLSRHMVLLTIQQQYLTDVVMTCYSLRLTRSLSFAFFAVKTLFFALDHSKGPSSFGRGTGRINVCACPPAPLPTTSTCDCTWYDSCAHQPVTRQRMQDASRVENRLCQQWVVCLFRPYFLSVACTTAWYFDSFSISHFPSRTEEDSN